MQSYKFGQSIKCPHCNAELEGAAEDYFRQGNFKKEGEKVTEECGECYFNLSMMVSHDKLEVYVTK